ncbi:MAG: ABC transporter permease [Cytophagales bacterium]|nr:ABC transporter permease [Cytophagales bacterium]
MNISYLISKRIRSDTTQSFSSTIIKIALTTIAIGLAIMIISVAILKGFTNNIQNKIFSFDAHIQISKFDDTHSFEELPVTINSDLYQNPNKIKEIRHIQAFCHKTGLLKTDEEVMGVILKGVGKDFDIKNFKNNILEGEFIDFSKSTYSKEIMISKKAANKLKLDIGDEILMYFVQNPPRYRKLIIAGIYETMLEEFDDLMVLADIKLIQKLNNWPDTLVGGYEIFLHDFNRNENLENVKIKLNNIKVKLNNIKENIDIQIVKDWIDHIVKDWIDHIITIKLQTANDKIFDAMDYDLQLETVTAKYIQLFDWLILLNRNVWIFLWFIVLVATFNIISTLIIMIMERTNMIGILKAIGATNWQIMKIFLYNGINLIIKGMLLGNVIGIGFCFLQKYFQIIPLDPENYYMDTVPIEWDLAWILFINIGTFLLISIILIIPTAIILNIKPINAIRFD